MSTQKKILTDSIFLTAGNYIIKLKGLIFMPIIINAVGLANYGVFVQIFVNLSMMNPFCTFALGEGFKRFTSKYDDNEKDKLSTDFWTVMSVSATLATIGSLVLFFLSPVICEALFKSITDDILWATRISSFMIIERVVWEQLNKYLLGRKKFKENTVLTLIYKFVPYLGLVAGFVFFESLAYAVTFFLILETLLMLFLLIKVVSGLRFVAPSFSVLRKFFRYSWALTFSQFESGVLAKVDRYFITYFLGPAALGAYNIIYSVVSFLDDLSLPFRRYYASYLPTLWDGGNTDKVLEQIRIGIRYFFILSWISLLLIVIGLDQLLISVLQEKAPVVENFIWVVLITGVGIIAEGATRLYYQVINMRKKNHFQILFQLIAVIFNVGLNYVLVPTMGLLGAGIATFVSYVFIVVINAKVFSIEAGYAFYMRIGLIALFGVPTVLIVQSYPASNIWEAILQGLICLFGFFGFLFATKIMRISELRSIAKKPKPKKKVA